MRNKSINKLTYILFDMIIIAGAIFLTILIMKFLGIKSSNEYIAAAIILIIFSKIIIFYSVGFYRYIAKYIGFKEIMYITTTNIVVNLIIISLVSLSIVPPFMQVPALVIITAFEIIGLVAYRVMLRLFFHIDRLNVLAKQNGKNTLIIGAGSAAELVLLEISRNKYLNNKIIGLLDDDETKIGRTVYDNKVLGKIQDAEYFINKYKIEEVIIAINHLELEKEIKLYDKISKYDQVKIKKIKLFEEYNESEKLRIVDVKVEDLLDREPVNLNNDDIKTFIEDEIVLVTGGGGSIGSELSRQIFANNPQELIIFDIYENNAYEIQMELETILRKNPNIKTKLTVLIGSVYNRKRMEEVFEIYKPTLVFHAAAYKHVPLMEHSSREAIRTNVLGTKNVSELANIFKVKKMVLVSSDKAVRPTNVMGATKRYAEMIIGHENSKGMTKYSAVRFGNVLGSNGSVIPLFKKQIEEGGPITVTDKEVTRYFMTIPESVGLILQSAVYANGGEIFVLDMGSPVKIYDLAKKMIHLSGHVLGKDMEIEITGLRPGEKLFEELLINDSNKNLLTTDHSRIFIEKDEMIPYDLLDYNYVLENFEELSNEKVKIMLSKIIDTYTITDN